MSTPPANHDDPTPTPIQPSVALDPTLVPAELKALPQWVCWKYEWNGKKWSKEPVNARTGKLACSNKPATWSTFEVAVAAWKRSHGRYAGVGIVLTKGDKYCGIDLDGCIDENGTIAPAAQAIIDLLASYTELSPSGRGVRIFVLASKLAEARCRSKAIAGVKEVEVYECGRYLTMTGAHLAGTPMTVEERQAELGQLLPMLWPPTTRITAETLPTPKPQPIALSDDAIIEKAKSAANGAKFKRLLDGDTSDYGGDDSRADLALCGLLAFWFQGDASKIDVQFRLSGLMRPKWDELRGAQTYGQRTIATALEGRTEYYSPVSGRRAESNLERHAKLLTDVGNAARLVLKYGDRIRFFHPSGMWYIWDGRRWTADDRGQIVKLCKKVALLILKEASHAKEGDRDRVVKWWRDSQRRDRLTAMAYLAQSEVPITADELDADRFLFNCLNGTLDLRTGELRKHDPNDLITKLAPVEYDPNATCSRFDQFMLETFSGDLERIDFIERWHGMCLTGDITEQYLPIYKGDGNNGKNVLLDTVVGLMGDYAGMAAPDLLTASNRDRHPTEIAELCGKRLVIASETERNAQLKMQLLKRLTGDERLKGRLMHGNFFEFPRTHKMILVTNNLPRVGENTEAVWRRLRVMPFDYVVPEAKRDKSLLQKLKPEWAGILAKLVQGCLRWQQSGLNEPVAVTKATLVFKGRCHSFQAFFSEACVIDTTVKTLTADLMTTYTEWCVENELVAEDPQCTSDFLVGKGCLRRKFRAAWHWVGVKLTDPASGHGGHGGRRFPEVSPCVPRVERNGKPTSTMSTLSTTPDFEAA